MSTTPTPDQEAKAFKVTDSEQAVKSFNEFRDFYKFVLQTEEAGVSRILQLNRDASSFYEKLAVLDAGVLVFFLNFVISRSHDAHISKAAFWRLFCPAEALLLISVYLCGLSIVHFHQANLLASKNLSSLWSMFVSQYLGVFTTKFGQLFSGEIQSPAGARVDISQLFSQLTASLSQTATDLEKARQKEMGAFRNRGWLAQIAQLMTLTGLVLLCIFMLKTLPV